MGKYITIVSFVMAAAGFAYMFNSSPVDSCGIGVVAGIVIAIGFWIESKAKYFWNTKFNKLMYYLSRDDREYNFYSKEFTYTCINSNEYRSEKVLTIYPTCNTVDRITERFAWSAPSNQAKIKPICEEHTVSAMRQQELWTYYSVFFHHTCPKREMYKTGSVIENLIDEHNSAVPFISATVDRKTKQLVMRVCFENRSAPATATFKVFSSKNNREEIHSETLRYDDVIKGFSKQIDFPRQNWKYVISW